MGSFPHELTGYRHISDPTVRGLFEKDWGVTLDPEPGLRIPNMFDAALDGSFRGIYIEGEDIAQSDPNQHHVAAALAGDGDRCRAGHLHERDREVRACLPAGFVVPGKERDLHQLRAAHLVVRKVIAAAGGQGGLGGHLALSQRAGLSDGVRHPSGIRTHWRVSLRFSPASPTRKLERLGSVQWPCNDPRRQALR